MSKKLPSGGHIALDVPPPDVSPERASSTSCARDSEAGKQLSEKWPRVVSIGFLWIGGMKQFPFDQHREANLFGLRPFPEWPFIFCLDAKTTPKDAVLLNVKF